MTDMSDEIVMRELQVGGLLGETYTGSWKTKVYRKKGMKNLESIGLSQCVISKLHNFNDTQRLLWQRTER